MKKIISVAWLLIALHAHGQTFEGTVKWEMKAEATDPRMKARMEQGQQRLKDPATQARIKEMQAKMNDPTMKAMMEANPQMKAQMESMMKMEQGVDMLPMMPSGFLFKVKGGNTVTLMEGGMVSMEVLHLKDQDKTIRLDRKNKTYSVLHHTTAAGQTRTPAPHVQVTKTSETMKILDYHCTKYIAAVTENGKTVNQIFWTTTEIRDFDMKSLTRQRMGSANQQLFYEGIDGVPLKIEISMPQANMVMQVLEIKKESLPASDFAVPSDYREVQGMPGK
jgi:hypothetical protein